MKNLIIIIGTIILGALIVNTFVLGDGSSSLYGAAKGFANDGIGMVNQQLNGALDKAKEYTKTP